ncbi:MAG: NUDIX hydrolase [Anaerolineae bacterium]|nr:NUDIX hydrolase [Anaerolineae bacterium]
MPIQDYPHPALTADVVLFAVEEGCLQVLLIRRDGPPFEGHWAFPGGFVDVGEPPRDAAQRELEEETGIRDVSLRQLRTFGNPGRDPRGHTVSVAYLGVMTKDPPPRAEAGSDAAEAQWWSVERLPPLAFDHTDILACALQRLSSEVAGVPVTSDVLPNNLTLGELRALRDSLARGADKRHAPIGSDKNRCR